ncbi:MAG: ribonuclease T [Gammaproteobacteria bacterium]|nr:ribonuclease T [Gammaproteobacteria bacterium]
MSHNKITTPMSSRFRGFLPVVVDVETGGFDHKKNALLEISAHIIEIDDNGQLGIKESVSCHVKPYEGLTMEPASMEVNGIDPYNPFRMAKTEFEALTLVFQAIRKEIKRTGCTRAVMVGHNTTLDLNFVNAAAERNKLARNPFHQFSMFDTVSLAGLAYGQTVLSRAVQAAGLEWDDGKAHSAVYDATKTAELFCNIVNKWTEFSNI